MTDAEDLAFGLVHRNVFILSDSDGFREFVVEIREQNELADVVQHTGHEGVLGMFATKTKGVGEMAGARADDEAVIVDRIDREARQTRIAELTEDTGGENEALDGFHPEQIGGLERILDARAQSEKGGVSHLEQFCREADILLNQAGDFLHRGGLGLHLGDQFVVDARQGRQRADFGNAGMEFVIGENAAQGKRVADLHAQSVHLDRFGDRLMSFGNGLHHDSAVVIRGEDKANDARVRFANLRKQFGDILIGKRQLGEHELKVVVLESRNCLGTGIDESQIPAGIGCTQPTLKIICDILLSDNECVVR